MCHVERADMAKAGVLYASNNYVEYTDFCRHIPAGTPTCHGFRVKQNCYPREWERWYADGCSHRPITSKEQIAQLRDRVAFLEGLVKQ